MKQYLSREIEWLTRYKQQWNFFYDVFRKPGERPNGKGLREFLNDVDNDDIWLMGSKLLGVVLIIMDVNTSS